MLLKLGFTGINCETKIDICSLGMNGTLICLNNGTCVNRLNNQNSTNEFLCACLPGYTGSRCESFKNPCESQPCARGTCMTLSDVSYQCVSDKSDKSVACPEGSKFKTLKCFSIKKKLKLSKKGFYGINCDLDINECIDNTTTLCHNNSTCLNTFGGYTCHCLPGFTGAHCELRLDNCYSNPCKNYGLCMNEAESSFRCICQPGFSGVLCDSFVDSCLSQPCFHGILYKGFKFIFTNLT